MAEWGIRCTPAAPPLQPTSHRRPHPPRTHFAWLSLSDRRSSRASAMLLSYSAICAEQAALLMAAKALRGSDPHTRLPRLAHPLGDPVWKLRLLSLLAIVATAAELLAAALGAAAGLGAGSGGEAPTPATGHMPPAPQHPPPPASPTGGHVARMKQCQMHGRLETRSIRCVELHTGNRQGAWSPCLAACNNSCRTLLIECVSGTMAWIGLAAGLPAGAAGLCAHNSPSFADRRRHQTLHTSYVTLESS